MNEIKLSDSNRFDILNSLRNGMLSEMQEFRAAMWKVTITTNAVIIALVSWLFTKDIIFSFTHKALLSLGITVFLITCLFILSALKQHFTDHAIVANKINKLFGVYEEGTYIENETLFLDKFSWARFGDGNIKEPLFRAAYVSVAVVYAYALIAIWAMNA